MAGDAVILCRCEKCPWSGENVSRPMIALPEIPEELPDIVMSVG